MEHTVVIKDTLQERVDDTISEVREALYGHFENNPTLYGSPPFATPSFELLDFVIGLNSIIARNIPTQDHEVRGLWYLYSMELEKSYELYQDDANYWKDRGVVALFSYIKEQVSVWYAKNDESPRPSPRRQTTASRHMFQNPASHFPNVYSS